MSKTDIVRKTIDLQVLQFTVVSGGEAQGTIRKIGDTYAVAWLAEDTFGTKTLVAGKTGTAITKCSEGKLPKVTGSGTAFVVGDTIWFNETNLNVSPTQGSGYTKKLGYATQAAAAAATGVWADYDFRYHSIST
jgi:hypothetical protein